MKSYCCNANLIAGVQCESCGADGRIVKLEVKHIDDDDTVDSRGLPRKTGRMGVDPSVKNNRD